MDALDDVALLQIAVLQQDLLERNVQKVRKRKRRRPRRYQMLLGLQHLGLRWTSFPSSLAACRDDEANPQCRLRTFF